MNKAIALPNVDGFTTERFLIGLGFLKLLAVFAFFASFVFIDVPHAHSGEGACKGENLLVKLEQEDPLAYRQVIAQARATANSDSIFWKVQKEGIPVSYLFGTMHLADPEISTLAPDVVKAMEDVDTVVIETLDVLDPQKAQAAMGQLAHLTLLSEGTLRDRVEDELEDELAAAVEARGIPMALADRMQPWLIATTISLPVCEVMRKQTGEQVLDSVIATRATETGKKLVGLETAAEQLEAIASLPEDYHVSALEETLASGNVANDMIQTLRDTYLAGDVGVVFPLMKVALPKAGDGEGAAQFQEALIEKRNITMVERSREMFQKGSVFMAVGALHLPDDNGIVAMLRNEGFEITPLR